LTVIAKLTYKPAMQIVFLDRSTFARDVRFALDRLPGCAWRDYPVSAADQVVERTRDAEVVLTNKVRIDAEALAQLPQLRLVCATATGVDNIDTAAARKRGVGVCNVRGYATSTVPEHVFALTLALRRNLQRYHQAARDGTWSRSPIFCLHDYPIGDLAGSTLAIVGGGALGQATARLGECFGMQVLTAERRGAPLRSGRVPFEQALREADVLSLHLPLTGDTRHLVGRQELAAMKRGAILINTARGALVDPHALLEALASGPLGGAGIDVLDTEPPPADHPLLAANLPHLIVTPHVAWASLQAQQRLADEVIENIAAFLRGESRNRVV
jgi:glycerate dehydrogenase